MQLYLYGININKNSQDKIDSFTQNFEHIFKKSSDLVKEMRKYNHMELVLISTCNRFEFIIYCHDSLIKNIKLFIKKIGINDNELITYEGMEVVKHLFYVTSGFESEVIGETMVVSQIKAAYNRALAAKLTKKVLNRLFQTSIKVSRKVRENFEYGLNFNDFLKYSLKFIERDIKLEDVNYSLIGKGKIIRGMAKLLDSLGCQKNVELVRGSLSSEKIKNFKDGKKFLKNSNLIIVDSDYIGYVLSKKEVLNILKEKLIILDYSLTRGVDINVRNMDGVIHYSRDELEPEDRYSISKDKIKKMGEKIIATEIINFNKYISNLKLDSLTSEVIDNMEVLLDKIIEKTPHNKLKKVIKKKFSKLIRDSFQKMVIF